MNKKTHDRIKKFFAYEQANFTEVPTLLNFEGNYPKEADRTHPKNVAIVKEILLSRGFKQTSERCFTKDAYDICIQYFAYHITIRCQHAGIGFYFRRLKSILDTLEKERDDEK